MYSFSNTILLTFVYNSFMCFFCSLYCFIALGKTQHFSSLSLQMCWFLEQNDRLVALTNGGAKLIAHRTHGFWSNKRAIFHLEGLFKQMSCEPMDKGELVSYGNWLRLVYAFILICFHLRRNKVWAVKFV